MKNILEASEIKDGFDCVGIAKEYFPDANEEEIGFILWEKTGYPSFFMEGEKTLREQLVKLKGK